jgi:TatA/E family protein of Tat protein translocase
MPFGISLPELLILLVVLLLVFGAKRLPEMGRSLGKGMREFKDGVSGVEESVTTTPTPTSVELPPPASEPSPQSSQSHSSQSHSEPESERQPVT